MNSFSVVRQFEDRVAEFSGSKYAVAVNTCTSAIFLCLEFMARYRERETVIVPAKTFISVPMAVLHAGLKLEFEDYEWKGVYQLRPYPIIDGALRFRKNMYQGGLHCLSFHARKLLNIGEGGMILTDDKEIAQWLSKAAYSGRGGSFKIEDVSMLGWQFYMTPEKAARGLHLMDYVEDWEDQEVVYPDLRKAPVFQ